MTKIETRQQYEWALGRIEALVDIVTEEMPEDDPAKMEYCILSNLVADYSDEHFDLGAPTLQEVLKEPDVRAGAFPKGCRRYDWDQPVKGQRYDFREMPSDL